MAYTRRLTLWPKEELILALGSPLSIGIGVTSRTTTFASTVAGPLSEFIGINPHMSGICDCIDTLYCFQYNSLSNQVMENFIVGILTKTVRKLVKAPLEGRSFKEIEAAEKTQPAIVT